MSQPSSWPLPSGSSRVVLPLQLTRQLARHALTKHLYPLAYGHYVDAVGHHVERKKHTDHLLIFCHRGRGYFRTAHAEGELKAGQLLLLPSNEAHTYAASTTQPWSIYWAHFQGTSAAACMDFLDLSPAQPVLTLTRWRQLIPVVTDLLNLQTQRHQFTAAVVAASLLQRIIAELPRLTSTLQVPTEFDLAALERFMYDNSHRDLSLDDFAEFAGLSRYYFSKKFKQFTGTSPMRYFNQIRVKIACQLLDNSADSIRQISQQLGFEDPYYFSRLFKKTMGMSPQFYRQTITNQRG
ncbi:MULTISPECIES: helix-turn-helix transcriptional regulator [Pseudidiomarina]|uniref:AraC-type DNA-binding domain and AraC-containing proteins n=2 Tax=Pseudidiomarina TaxID=2800384 RepID=A0A0K6GWC5_9GAMM|nr:MULTISPECIES: AraC family transcriptional regulator [Pseudidiomarina]RUO49714.1 AraC family transcriptional regulator [Pseudidiomarina donghaiensis]CUA83026.1 AraC-type DNA-binding domain and AraC-containing proteins [Pseudidiomarina woesei]SFV21706.1 AraC-type DNA-binding protein [Pseudidiomarina donghaiensis]